MEEISDAECACQGAEVRIKQLNIAVLRGVSVCDARNLLTCWEELVGGIANPIEAETNYKQDECDYKRGAVSHQPDEYTQVFLSCDQQFHCQDD